MPSDPFYETGPAGFIRRCLEHFHHIELVVDDQLGTRGAVDPDDRVIWAPPGLALPDFHWLAARAGLWMRYPDAVPEFSRRPVRIHSHDHHKALIIPMPRRPRGSVWTDYEAN